MEYYGLKDELQGKMNSLRRLHSEHSDAQRAGYLKAEQERKKIFNRKNGLEAQKRAIERQRDYSAGLKDYVGWLDLQKKLKDKENFRNWYNTKNNMVIMDDELNKLWGDKGKTSQWIEEEGKKSKNIMFGLTGVVGDENTPDDEYKKIFDTSLSALHVETTTVDYDAKIEELDSQIQKEDANLKQKEKEIAGYKSKIDNDLKEVKDTITKYQGEISNKLNSINAEISNLQAEKKKYEDRINDIKSSQSMGETEKDEEIQRYKDLIAKVDSKMSEKDTKRKDLSSQQRKVAKMEKMSEIYTDEYGLPLKDEKDDNSGDIKKTVGEIAMEKLGEFIGEVDKEMNLQQAAPQQNGPAAPQQNGPAAPQQKGPAAPQQNGPAAPQQNGPAAPQQNGPAAPQQNGPAAPQQNGPAAQQAAAQQAAQQQKGPAAQQAAAQQAAPQQAAQQQKGPAAQQAAAQQAAPQQAAQQQKGPAAQQAAAQQAAPQQAAPQQAAPQQKGQATQQQADGYVYYGNIKSIKINAKDGKMIIVKADTGETLELEIEGKDGAVRRGKKELKSEGVDQIIERSLGKKGKFSIWVAKKKINPAIIGALYLKGDPKGIEAAIEKYIAAVVKGKGEGQKAEEMPFGFDYEIDLSDSTLSTGTKNLLNRRALEERKILPEGKVKGEKETLWEKVKKIFARDKEALEGQDEPKKLDSGEEKKKIKTQKFKEQQAQMAKQDDKEKAAKESKINEYVDTFLSEWSKLPQGQEKNEKLAEYLRSGYIEIAKELKTSDRESVLKLIMSHERIKVYRKSLASYYKFLIFEYEEKKVNGKPERNLIPDENGKYIVKQAMVEELAKYDSAEEIAKHYFQEPAMAELMFNNEKVKEARKVREAGEKNK